MSKLTLDDQLKQLTGKAGAPVKRFVAGAICPKCAQLDVIQSWQTATHQEQECIECGHTASMPLAADELVANQQELPTRVNQTPVDPKDEIQVVKIM